MKTNPKNVNPKKTAEKLAILGGTPVHEKGWPPWPRAGMAAQRAVLDVLHSQRWTITARSQREQCYERQFGETFSKFIGRRFGVPCSSGTSALTIALQALDIGPGDEVIVPGMTWVACASSVINIGAIPILIDIDARSLCMTASSVENAISSATKAVLGIHMYSSRADILGIEEICHRHGIALIEDGSQAHGAILGNQRIGTFGAISVFSFQQTKLLTSGEGGIALTDDPEIYQRLQKLRADGRIYADHEIGSGFYDLLDIGGLVGRNLCLSEFQAAILLEGLHRLPRENEHRRIMATMLGDRLSQLGQVHLIQDELYPQEGATFYKLPLCFDSCEEFIELGPEQLSLALTHELNLPVEPLDKPLNNNPLYQPQTSISVSRYPANAHRFNPHQFRLPSALSRYKSCIALPHPCLMGGEPEIDAIVAALSKIKYHAKTLSSIAKEALL